MRYAVGMAATGTAQRNWLVDYVPTGCFYADDYHRTCANCGQGIANVVTAQHRTTGEHVFLGLDCAERVGLTDAQLRDHYAEKFAAERSNRQAANRRAKRQAEAAARLAAAPSPPPQPFRFVRPADDPDALYYDEALFDLDGELVCAKPVSTRYGRSWMVMDRWDGEPVAWFKPSSAKDEGRARKADAAKGYYVGWAGWVANGSHNRRWANRDLAPVALEDNGQFEIEGDEDQ